MHTNKAGIMTTATRRQIERDFLARRSLTLHRMNLATVILLSLLLVILMTALLFSSSILYELAGRFLLYLTDAFGLTPLAGQDVVFHLAGSPPGGTFPLA